MHKKHPLKLFSAERFGRHWRAIGGAPCDAFETLRAHYSEKHRAYHNAEHVTECLAWLYGSSDLAERPDEVAVAIYFHDAIYHPGAADNETLSATLLRSYAEQACVPSGTTERVAGLIEATGEHVGQARDAALLNDIDQAIMGSSPARYARYLDGIRHEYAAYSDEHFMAGRAAFLEMQLGKLSIYATGRFQSEREAQARRNLAREAEGLKHVMARRAS